MNEELSRAQQQQLDHLARLEAAGESVGGWKLGLTSGGSRDAFGAGVRPFGFILHSRILEDGATLDWSRIGNGGIENEVCFAIASDIREPVTADTVRNHLAGTAPAFEINQRRIDASSPPAERIADDLANWGIVVGPMQPVPADPAFDQMTVTLRRGAETVASVASAGHIDDHFETLARLANQLLDYGRQLSSGDRVITGAFGRQPQPEPGSWSGDFGPSLGTVSMVIES
jgi:2-keto-4-pentenoate hydratase